ncbi:MAG: zinc-binding alcohol dehydrogenase family protein [Rhodobacteraceae bacterium]|nr:zinc-binding alcohol dehydrogenase family protein [Paracoccaceae bacterium]
MIPNRHDAIAWDPDAGALCRISRETEAPQGHDLLVEVAAVSLNPVDLKVRGFTPADAPPRVLGFDAVGKVLACGPEAQGFAPGDRVWYAGAAHRAGANAQLHHVDARITAHAPASLSDADAAALPLTALTAWEGLFERLGYAPLSAEAQQPLLMINGAGGVGSMVLQLARASSIAVTATASRAESQAWCRDLGAGEVLAHGALADMPDAAFPRIFCAHDTSDYMAAMGRLIAPQGRICAIVGARGPLDLLPLFQKSASFSWEYMFTRPLFGTDDIARQGAILAEVARLADAGAIRTTRTRTLAGLTCETFAEAHEIVASGSMIGKLVVTF